MAKILFVCAGNLCRSVMAVAIAKKLLDGQGKIESAGTIAVDGQPPTSDAILVMKERGMDINGHRSRNIREVNVDDFDLIVALDPEIAYEIIPICITEPKRLVILNIEDPYRKGIDEYRRCADELEAILPGLRSTYISKRRSKRLR